MNDKKMAAPTPPMGWNSWDCYMSAVTEEQILGNARYMAEHLKRFMPALVVVGGVHVECLYERGKSALRR